MFEMIQSILLHATHKGSTYFTNEMQKKYFLVLEYFQKVKYTINSSFKLG